jgi:hypothetical protein
MIQANITTYVGQDMEAEHYYCHYFHEFQDKPAPKQYNGSRWRDEELKFSLTESECVALNKKDRGYRHRVGDTTNRFASHRQIHEELLKQFPGQTIVCYDDGRVSKDMLYIVRGKENLGYKFFGEVWTSVFSSVYKDLLPEDTKYRCYHCKKEYEFDDISHERVWGDRTLVEFLKKRDMDDPCDCYELEWNAVI